MEFKEDRDFFLRLYEEKNIESKFSKEFRCILLQIIRY